MEESIMKEGFTLYEGIPDTKNTYYGVLILKLLGVEPENIDKTIEWVEYLQRGRMFGLKGLFYRVNILKLLNREPELNERYFERFKSKKKFPSMEIAFMYTSILKTLGYECFDNISGWINSHQTKNGGFGVGNSDITQTCYAVESLNMIDPSLIHSEDNIINFINTCTASSVYVYTPQSYPPYIETVYSGVRINQILGKAVAENDKILKFVENLQNPDGGFRRSPYIGISELEYTYKAIHVLKQ